MADFRLVVGVLTYFLTILAMGFGLSDLVHATINFFSPEGSLVFGLTFAVLAATLTALFRMLEAHPPPFGLTPILRAAPALSLGALLGAIAYAAVVFVQWGVGLAAIRGLQTGPGPQAVFLASLARNPGIAFGEELTFRGQILSRLSKRVGFAVAAILSSLLYAGSHLRVNGFGPGAFIGLTLLGLLLAGLFRRTGTLWAPIGFHAAWNIIQGGVFGLSMLDRFRHGTGLVALEQRGPVALVGAGFLTEGGLVAIAVLAASTTWCTLGANTGKKGAVEQSDAADEAG